MCDAISLAVAGLALTAASAGTAYAAQQQQASAQEDYQSQMAKAQQAAAMQQEEALRLQQAQEQEAAARAAQKVQKQAREALATAKVGAAEAGVTGVSVDALMCDFERQQFSQLELIQRQTQLTDLSINQQIEATRMGGYNASLATNSPISRPSFLTTALQIGSGAINAAGTYNSLKGPSVKPTVSSRGSLYDTSNPD